MHKQYETDGSTHNLWDVINADKNYSIRLANVYSEMNQYKVPTIRNVTQEFNTWFPRKLMLNQIWLKSISIWKLIVKQISNIADYSICSRLIKPESIINQFQYQHKNKDTILVVRVSRITLQ